MDLLVNLVLAGLALLGSGWVLIADLRRLRQPAERGEQRFLTWRVGFLTLGVVGIILAPVVFWALTPPDAGPLMPIGAMMVALIPVGVGLGGAGAISWVRSVSRSA